MSDIYHIWADHPGAYMILEHLGNNDEEAALANGGFMLWGKMTESKSDRKAREEAMQKEHEERSMLQEDRDESRVPLERCVG